MKLTPLDFVQKEFSSRMRGLDPEEVHTFLDEARQALEDALHRNRDLEGRLARQEDELARYKEKERLLNETLLLAQQVREDTQRSARKEGEVIVQQAQLEADEILAEASLQKQRFLSQIEELRQQRGRYLAELNALLETHRTLIELTRSQIASETTLPPTPASPADLSEPPVEDWAERARSRLRFRRWQRTQPTSEPSAAEPPSADEPAVHDPTGEEEALDELGGPEDSLADVPASAYDPPSIAAALAELGEEPPPSAAPAALDSSIAEEGTDGLDEGGEEDEVESGGASEADTPDEDTP